MRVVVVGHPASLRLTLFQAALARAGAPPAELVPWLDVLADPGALARHLAPGVVVRLESPGQDFAVERALIALGAATADAPGPARIGRAEALALAFDKGRIWYPRQWYLGFCAALSAIGAALAAAPGVRVLTPPATVALLFDKPACHRALSARGVPVPERIAPAGSYAELRAALAQAGVDRCFVKLAHGSSASGVVALSLRPGREYALTSAERAAVGGETVLYNSRRLRRYARAPEMAEVLDLLCREGVHVERWLPKAIFAGSPFDLRVLVIAGRARHAVVRLGRGPITNLHLGSRRRDPAELVARMGDEAWAHARAVCERAAAAFPGALHVGVDLLVEPGYRRCAVLEANAFGDLLPGVTEGGQDPYDAEIAEALAA